MAGSLVGVYLPCCVCRRLVLIREQMRSSPVQSLLTSNAQGLSLSLCIRNDQTWHKSICKSERGLVPTRRANAHCTHSTDIQNCCFFSSLPFPTPARLSFSFLIIMSLPPHWGLVQRPQGTECRPYFLASFTSERKPDLMK